MKVRPTEPLSAQDGERTQAAPHALADRLRALLQRTWLARWADRTDPFERGRGGTRLHDWPEPRHEGTGAQTAWADTQVLPQDGSPPQPDGHGSPREAGHKAGRHDRQSHDGGELPWGDGKKFDTEPAGRLHQAPALAEPAQPTEAQWPRQFDRLSQLMADLCGRRSKAPDSWNLQVDLDPQIVPDTRLHLCASQHAIQFRFACGSPQVQHLLLSHVGALKQRIADQISESRPFDIEIE